MSYTLLFCLIIFFSLDVFARQNLADKLPLPETTCEIPKNSMVIKADLKNYPIIIKPFVDIDRKMNICQPIVPTIALFDPIPKYDGTTQQSKIKSVLSRNNRKTKSRK